MDTLFKITSLDSLLQECEVLVQSTRHHYLYHFYNRQKIDQPSENIRIKLGTVSKG